MSLTELSNQKTVSIDLLSGKTGSALQTMYSVLDDVPFALAVLKGESLIIEFINKYNLEIWKRRKEDVIGKPLFEARPDLKEAVAHIHQEIYNTGKRFFANEVPVDSTNNGKKETRYFNDVIDPIIDEKGKIIGQLATSIEVTEQVLARKKVEESEALLRKTKEQLELSIEAGQIGVWHWDVKKKQMTWSKEQLEMFGVDKEDFKGEAYDFFKHVIEEDQEKIRKASGLEFQRSENQYEFRIRRKDGEIRWIQSRSKTYMDENNNPQYITGINVDITDQVVTHKKIEESEIRYRNIFETAEVSLWEEDFTDVKAAIDSLKQRGVKDFRQYFKEHPEFVQEAMGLIKVTDVNQTTIEMFEAKDKMELLGSLPSIFTSESINVFAQELIAIAEEKRFFEAEAGLNTVKGNPVWILFTMKLPPSTEKFDRVLFSCLDISKIKIAEAALKENEEKNRLFIEYAPAAMAMFDKEMRYVSVSKQWMKEYDLTGNIIGQKHYELFPNILQRWKDVHSRCLRGAVEKSDEDFYIKDDGSPVWLRWEVHPWYNASGEIGGIVIFTENITERKKHEQAIKESENRFRTMANEAPLFVWETDENLQTTYLNKEGLNYFFLDDLFNMSELSWKQFIHPDDIDRVLEIMKDAADMHSSYTLEMRLKNGRTGEYHWFLDKGAPRYANDKFIGFIGTSLDIHERKEIEKALEEKVNDRTRELAGQNILLKKQNDLVKKIFDSSVDAMGVYDTELRIVTLNESSLKMIGRKEKDVIGKKLLEVLPQVEGTKGHKDLLNAMNGKTIHNKAFHSEITNRYYENFLMPLKDEKDNVYAVLVIAHDNTELITSTEKLKEAQLIAQIGHWEWDVVTNKVVWSDNMYNMYGLDPKEGIDYDKFMTLVHPDDRAAMQANLDHGLQTHTFNDFFHRIITPTGIEKIMHARGEVIIDKSGQVLRMVGTGQDVSKQKMTEQQLITTSKKIEERNQFIEQLINSSLDLIMVIDKDMRFITMNKKAQGIYREYYKEDIIGKKVTEVNPPVKGTEAYDDLQQALSGKVIIKDKVKSTISDRYYEHNYVPLTNANGEVYAVMIISHDITESMRQMEVLKKLYESDEQKNNFIAMASHELKTPITSIKGYVQLLLNAVEKEKDRQKPLPPLLVRSSLLSVDKQIKRLTRLISELLDISKIETGTLELKKEKFSLNELAIETVEDILYTNTRHQINLYHDHHSNVFGDKDRIGQVMINFLTNAVKYSPESDKIDVTIHKPVNSEIAFSVKDYGIGIDKEEQEKIFERFYRAKGKEEQTYPGFGIGLFIAKEFVQKHEGRIMVESEKGKGSVFTFILPVNSKDL